MMKVVHISYSDNMGGAAIAAYRHHEAMRRAGIDSKMLVVEKKLNDPNVYKIKTSPSLFFWKIANRLVMSYYKFYAAWSWARYGNDVSNNLIVQDADVIVLHWINRYTLSISSIEKLLKTGKPIYWFMHDMWPITGGCHYSFDCTKYKKQCFRCEMAHNHAGSKRDKDLSYRQFAEKLKRLAPYRNLRFLTPSKWLADRVKESALFGNHEVKVVRNVLDTEVFKPVNQQEARKRLGLPLDKKLILFGADNISSPYKGWGLLREALLQPFEDAEAVVYGTTPPDLQSQVGINLHSMGHISDISQLVDLYSACDVFVTPSLADNYPNVLIEAMACGLPCVGTNVGGIPEIVRDGRTGLLTPLDNPGMLRTAIISVLDNADGKFDKSTIRSTIIDCNGHKNEVTKFSQSNCLFPID